MKRASLLVLSSLSSAVLLLSVASTSAQNAQAPASEAVKPAEQVFKNIQTLKGVPADQVQPAMQFISNSLGVECEFCHVQGAFEKDDKKPKQTARQMIEMQMAINKGHFKDRREVTCYTCHHGAHDPVSVPIIAEEEPKRPEAVTGIVAAPAPGAAERIIDKYLEAVGGGEALQKVLSRVQKGTITFGGQQFPLEVFAKAPNKRISIVHTPNGDSITAFDGHAGWLGNPGERPPRDMTAEEADTVNLDATFYLPLEIKKMFTQFRLPGPSADKIAGHFVHQVIGVRQGKTPVRFFFDKESGLLLRTVRYAETPLGRNPIQVDYTDYRSEGGVKIPFQWTVARPLGRFTINVTEVQQNVPVEDKKFEKPAAVAAPAAK